MLPTESQRRRAPRIHFESPISVKMMAIDGTWCRGCLLIEVSDSDAQLTVEGLAASIQEFFLVLSSAGSPAFRRCKRVWVNGDQMGVQFDKHRASGQSLEQSRRNWKSTSN